MRLRRLKIANVRGVTEREVTFLEGDADTGVVIVEGRNEAGKTTLADALDALLLHKHTSRRQDIRSLQTVGVDAGPEIEADLDAGPYRITYRKRFLRDPMAEVEIHRPRAERLSGETAHDRVEAILDESIDRELWRALRLEQSEGLHQAVIGSTSGLTTALEERCGTSGITERELRVLDRVRDEYLRYFTEKGNERKHPLGEAREAVATAEQRLADVDRRLAELEADIGRADALNDELPRLREHCEHAERRAAELTARREEVDALAADVAKAEQELLTATAEADRLADRHAQRERLLESLSADRRARSEFEQELDAAESSLRSAEALRQEAEQALVAARDRQRAAREAREQAQSDLEHLRDRESLESLQGRRRRADDAAVRLREAEDVVAAVGVDDRALGELRSAEQEVHRARAVLEASSPVVRFTADRAVDVEVEGRDQTFGPGESGEWPVTGSLDVRLGDVGTVQVRAGPDAENAAEVHAGAVQRFEEALRHAGVADLDEAEASSRRRRIAEQAAEQARRDRDTALEGETTEALVARIEALERRTARYACDRDGDWPLPADLGVAQRVLKKAVAREVEADGEIAAFSAEVERARAEQETARGTAIECRTRVAEIDRRLGVLEDELAAARQEESDQALLRNAEVAASVRAQAERKVEKARQDLEDAGAEEVRTQAEHALVAARDAAQDVAVAEQQLRDLRTAIRIRGGEGLYEQREDGATQLTHARAELASVERRANAAKLLLDTLDRRRALVRDRYANPVREQIVRLGRMLHGPDFDVELDENLRVVRRHVGGLWLDTGQLSVGAREQLALLGRTACAMLLDDRGGVLIFDDALGNTDPWRLEAVGAVLRLAGEHCQVVVLTCYPERFRHVGTAAQVTLD